MSTMKIPKFMGMNTKPFEKETFRAAAEGSSEDNFTDPDGGQVGEIIRWRWTTDAEGNRVPESNARIVEWSDGSRTLMVGDESFGVKLENNPAHTELWARHDRAAILECHGSLLKKWNLRPNSIKSKTHARLAAAAIEKDSKERDKARVKMYNEAGFEDHEKLHEKREKARDEILRSRDKYGGSDVGMGYDYSIDSGEMTGNLGALRAQFKKGRGRQINEDRLMRAKGGLSRDDDSPSELSDDDAGIKDEGFIVDDEEDDDDDDSGVGKRAAKRAKTAMSDDDD